MQPRIPRLAHVRARARVGDGRSSATCRSPPSSATCCAGRPVVYTTFLAYDEVAHHSGIERHDTLAVAAPGRPPDRPDRSRRSPTRRGRTSSSCSSDHGQSQGATFADRYGVTLEDLVRAACDADARRGARRRRGRGAGLPRRRADRGRRRRHAAGRAVRVAPPASAAAGGAVTLEPEARAEVEAATSCPRSSVMASGCLGLVSLPARARARDARAARRAATRDSRRRCARIPGIGFVARALRAARRASPSARAARHYLDEERVEGEDPLAPFGPNAAAPRAAHRRLPALPRRRRQQHLLARHRRGRRLRGARRLARRDGRQPVATRSSCFPSELRCPTSEVVGAEHMHRVLRRWLVELGHDAYRDEAEVTAAGGGGSPPATR